VTARRLGYAAALATVASSGWYLFVYLSRWEWNRGLTSGVIFVAAEIALFGILALDRIGRLRVADRPSGRGRPAGSGAGNPHPRTLAHVRAAAPTPRRYFAWLRPESTNVFVPVLLGAGVVVSALAWLVERVARATAGRQMERGLAARLETLAPPDTLVPHEADPLVLFAPLLRTPDAAP
jgi:hypothetical protein